MYLGTRIYKYGVLFSMSKKASHFFKMAGGKICAVECRFLFLYGLLFRRPDAGTRRPCALEY